jgi:hypothetical protein
LDLFHRQLFSKHSGYPQKPSRKTSIHKQRIQYVWAKDKEGKEYLQETESIDIQAEIESYADECDIKNIVRKASFDPEFMKSLSQGAMEGTEIDITEFPQNIHEYHQMLATAQANAMKLRELEELNKEQKKEPVEGSKTEE